eukprot:scaffold16707_cov182-Amphora_coffeaeformis.AAC.8
MDGSVANKPAAREMTHPEAPFLDEYNDIRNSFGPHKMAPQQPPPPRRRSWCEVRGQLRRRTAWYGTIRGSGMIPGGDIVSIQL